MIPVAKIPIFGSGIHIAQLFCLFDLILYIQSTIFQYPGLNQYSASNNVLAEGHNTVMSVRLKPAAPRSRVKHSTIEPLRSHIAEMPIFGCGIPIAKMPILRSGISIAKMPVFGLGNK